MADPFDPRRATESEISQWIEIADSRNPPPQYTIEQLREYLRRCNRFRWMRLQHDFRWASKQLLKIGVDPEDVRWLL